MKKLWRRLTRWLSAKRRSGSMQRPIALNSARKQQLRQMGYDWAARRIALNTKEEVTWYIDNMRQYVDDPTTQYFTQGAIAAFNKEPRP